MPNPTGLHAMIALLETLESELTGVFKQAKIKTPRLRVRLSGRWEQHPPAKPRTDRIGVLSSPFYRGTLSLLTTE